MTFINSSQLLLVRFTLPAASCCSVGFFRLLSLAMSALRHPPAILQPFWLQVAPVGLLVNHACQFAQWVIASEGAAYRLVFVVLASHAQVLGDHNDISGIAESQ